MGESTYTITSRRGGMRIGYVEFRNQWQAWSVKFDNDVPLNMEILAEAYKFLKLRETNDGKPRARWRAALRDWMLRWL